jgi:hypothetical protein
MEFSVRSAGIYRWRRNILCCFSRELWLHEFIDEIAVTWPDGETSQIPGPLKASGTNQISRRVLR